MASPCLQKAWKHQRRTESNRSQLDLSRFGRGRIQRFFSRATGEMGHRSLAPSHGPGGWNCASSLVGSCGSATKDGPCGKHFLGWMESSQLEKALAIPQVLGLLYGLIPFKVVEGELRYSYIFNKLYIKYSLPFNSITICSCKQVMTPMLS